MYVTLKDEFTLPLSLYPSTLQNYTCHMEYIVHGSKNQMIVTLKLLWSEFAETNERGFDLLLQILITHRLSVT